MELTDLRYFLAVARLQNLQRAADQLHVTPGALSKAVARLEAELGLKLFQRSGRNIVITEHGQVLQRRAFELVRLEEATRLDLLGSREGLHVTVVGPEVLLARVGFTLIDTIRQLRPGASFEVLPRTSEEALEDVLKGNAHLGVVTGACPPQLATRSWDTITFRVCTGPSHPLYERAAAGQPVVLEDVLEHTFACSQLPTLSHWGLMRSPDEWDDVHFPRKVAFLTSSLTVVIELARSGRALVYLPEDLARQVGLLPIVLDTRCCSCEHLIQLVAHQPQETSWLNQLF